MARTPHRPTTGPLLLFGRRVPRSPAHPAGTWPRAESRRLYVFHEQALRQTVEAMGCKVTSNMTSLVVFNLTGTLAGKEKELVANCRAEEFGIWNTLSDPAQIRIGILN